MINDHRNETHDVVKAIESLAKAFSNLHDAMMVEFNQEPEVFDLNNGTETSLFDAQLSWWTAFAVHEAKNNLPPNASGLLGKALADCEQASRSIEQHEIPF